MRNTNKPADPIFAKLKLESSLRAFKPDFADTITILPELESLIPSLLTTELAQLSANLEQEGCREALLVWPTTEGIVNGTDNPTTLNILIDGHNRYRICTRKGIKFRVSPREFDSLSAAKEFMIDNQLGRRNLTPEQMSYLRGKKYRQQKNEPGRQAGLANGQPEPTKDRLAREFEVSPSTILRDADFSAGIDKLTTDVKRDVLGGKQKISKGLLRTLGKTDTIREGSLSLANVASVLEEEATGQPSSPGPAERAALNVEVSESVLPEPAFAFGQTVAVGSEMADVRANFPTLNLTLPPNLVVEQCEALISLLEEIAATHGR